MILAQSVPEIYSSEAVGGVVFGPFASVDSFRLEVHSDVISAVPVEPTGVKASVKFSDSRSNRSRDT